MGFTANRPHSGERGYMEINSGALSPARSGGGGCVKIDSEIFISLSPVSGEWSGVRGRSSDVVRPFDPLLTQAAARLTKSSKSFANNHRIAKLWL